MGFDQTVPEHGLVKAGVFRLSRNPIYLGLFSHALKSGDFDRFLLRVATADGLTLVTVHG